MARENMRVKRADDGDLIDVLRARPSERLETGISFQRWRSAALRVPRIADERGEACGKHIDRDARDDLVAALANGSEAMDEGKADRGDDACRQPDDRAIGGARGGGGGKSGGEHFALKADIDHAGTLRP